MTKIALIAYLALLLILKNDKIVKKHYKSLIFSIKRPSFENLFLNFAIYK